MARSRTEKNSRRTKKDQKKDIPRTRLERTGFYTSLGMPITGDEPVEFRTLGLD